MKVWRHWEILVHTLCLIGAFAWPGTAAWGGDFSMRRVSPPETGAKRLITVQIDPAADAIDEEVAGSALDVLDNAIEGLEPLGPVLPTATSGGAPEDWLWHVLPLGQGPERLAQAAALLESERQDAKSAATRHRIRQIGQKYGAAIMDATEQANVSPALVLAVIVVESAGRSDAVSYAGAGGLMQLMPATATRFGVRERFDPAQNIRGGVAYLDWLLRKFQGDAILALAGYNAGENAVLRHGGVPPFDETRAYVPKVISAWRIASELCSTAQRTARDPCAWNALASIAD